MSNPNIPDPISSRSDPHDSTLPADPLLQNGSFIDATAQPSINRKTDNNKPAAPQSSTSLNGAQSATPIKSRRKVPVTTASPPSDSTSWLPPGWLVEDRLRINGATAGTMDRYYIEPVTNRRFRSKVEVQHYLATGELLKNKRKKEAENSKTDVNPQEVSGKKKGSKKAKGPDMTFDRLNVPDRIEWALTNANEDVWTPFFDGDKKVPEFTKQNWEFEMHNLNEGQKKW
ncbi:methyl-CpG-binding domain-containing protein 5-like [Euphorbia lathyris]|uniref:methyl-CpG-binding domain-containing protein 5-like n=1 Tax=Euphorbia lathyris TaxID=212925 RepID=UPI003313BAFE